MARKQYKPLQVAGAASQDHETSDLRPNDITSTRIPKIKIKTFTSQSPASSREELPENVSESSNAFHQKSHHPILKLSLKRSTHANTNSIAEKSTNSKKRRKAASKSNSQDFSNYSQTNHITPQSSFDSFSESTELKSPNNLSPSSPTSRQPQPKLKLRLQLPKLHTLHGKTEKSISTSSKNDTSNESGSQPNYSLDNRRTSHSDSIPNLSTTKEFSKISNKKLQAAKKSDSMSTQNSDNIDTTIDSSNRISPPVVTKEEPVDEVHDWSLPDNNPQKNKKFFRIGPGFKRTHQNFDILDTLGNKVYAILACRIDRGFHHVADEWITYRRNYITISTAFSLTSGDAIEYGRVPRCNLYVDLGDGKVKIHYFSLRISAIEVDFLHGFQDVALIQHTPKRNRGVKRAPPLIPAVPGLLPSHEFIKNNTTFRTSSRKKMVESYITYPKAQLGDFGQYYPPSADTGDNIPFVGLFERIQFTTPIGGDSRQVKTLVQLIVTLEKGDSYVAAWCETPYFTLRIRSPSSYGDNVSLVQRRNGLFQPSPTLPRAIVQIAPGKPKVVSKFEDDLEEGEDDENGSVPTPSSGSRQYSATSNLAYNESPPMSKVLMEAASKGQKIAPNPVKDGGRWDARHMKLNEPTKVSPPGPEPHHIYKAKPEEGHIGTSKFLASNVLRHLDRETARVAVGHELNLLRKNANALEDSPSEPVKVYPKNTNSDPLVNPSKRKILPFLQPRPAPPQLPRDEINSATSGHVSHVNSMLQNLKVITAKSKVRSSASLIMNSINKMDASLNSSAAGFPNEYSDQSLQSNVTNNTRHGVDYKGKGKFKGKKTSGSGSDMHQSPTTNRGSSERNHGRISSLDKVPFILPKPPPDSIESDTPGTPLPNNSDSRQDPDVLKLVEVSYSEPRNPVALDENKNGSLKILPSGSLFSAPSMPAPRNTGKVFKVGRRQVRRNWSDHQTIFKFTKFPASSTAMVSNNFNGNVAFLNHPESSIPRNVPNSALYTETADHNLENGDTSG